MNISHKISDKSLLRYPGGKTRGVEIISQYFPSGLTEVCSPFFGGGSIELFLTGKGIKVFGYDIFNPLVEFWQCTLKDANILADAVQAFYPLSKQRFYELQAEQMHFKTKLERAAVYYVLNRSSFSGATLSGGMSPQHPRFTQSSIDRLRNFYNPNLTVNKLHFNAAIAKHGNMFLYLDPPYIIESTLYGRKGDAHKGFNHNELAEILQKRNQWILSYNDCAEIRKLYKGYRIITPNWKYGMSSNKISNEVLILSDDVKTVV